jgi:hypothetical protein
VVFAVQEGAVVLFFIFSIVMKERDALMLSDSELLTCEMLQVAGIMSALLVDVVGILLLLGGLIFGFVMGMIAKCKGKEGGNIDIAADNVSSVALDGQKKNNQG